MVNLNYWKTRAKCVKSLKCWRCRQDEQTVRIKVPSKKILESFTVSSMLSWKYSVPINNIHNDEWRDHYISFSTSNEQCSIGMSESRFNSRIHFVFLTICQQYKQEKFKMCDFTMSCSCVGNVISIFLSFPYISRHTLS